MLGQELCCLKTVFWDKTAGTPMSRGAIYDWQENVTVFVTDG